TTRAVGMAVHVISSPVWPWIGGPSDSSSGDARNFQIEYAITAATTAKIATQITVTNQKTKSMRPASRPAGVGSHPGTSATAVATPPATRAKSTSWTTDPRRTANEPTSSGGSGAPETGASPFWLERRLNGTRSWNLPDGARRDPRVRRPRYVVGGERPHRRLDS